MNAPTAPPDPSTRKTSAIATATAASSGTPQRIDDFIKRKLGEAVSVDGSGIIDSAARAAQFGFVNAANVRYSRFLEAFRSSPRLTEMYREKYPSSLFLPWTALHAVIKALDLWVELPQYYAGALPPEQLPWLEIFDFDVADVPILDELADMLGSRVTALGLSHLSYLAADADERRFLGAAVMEPHIAAGLIRHEWRVKALWEEARESLFVVAPAAAFTSRADWFSRWRTMADAVTEVTVPPPDPLVIRFCHGGAIVVAAWGDEAAALNELTKELKL